MMFLSRAIHTAHLKTASTFLRNAWIRKEGFNMELRAVQPFEKDTILALNKNAFNELDYLSDNFDFYMKDQQRICFAAYEKDLMVAFFVGLFLDKQQSLLIQSGRMNDSFLGQGIFSLIGRRIHELAGDIGIKKFISIDSLETNRSEGTRSNNRDLATKVLFITPFVDAKAAVDQTSPARDTARRYIHHITPTGIVENYFTSETIKQYLYPSGRFVVEYVPMATIPENLKLVAGKNTHHFSSVRMLNNEMHGLLSSAHIVKHQNGTYSYSITIVGKNRNDLESHLQFHHSRAIEMISGPYCYQILVEDPCVDELPFLVQKCGLKKDGVAFIRKGIISVYEMLLR